MKKNILTILLLLLFIFSTINAKSGDKKLLDQNIDKSPDSSLRYDSTKYTLSAKLKLAEAYYKKSNFKEAINVYKNFIRQYYTYIKLEDVKLNLAIIYFYNSDYDEMQKIFKELNQTYYSSSFGEKMHFFANEVNDMDLSKSYNDRIKDFEVLLDKYKFEKPGNQ